MYDKNQPRNIRQLLCAAGVLFILLGSATAHAQDFKTHYDLALALYQAQKFEESIPEFKAAYKLNPKPALLFNLAQAYRKAGHPREAVEHYDMYLSATPQLDGETRHKVDGYLAEARNTLASLELEMKRRLAEDKAAREHDPEPTPTPAPPPVVASPPAAVLVMPSPAPAVKDQPAPTPIYKRWWLWTAVGGAVAAGVIAGAVVGSQHTSTPVVVASGIPRSTITF